MSLTVSLNILAKAPLPGRAKTRLIPALGAEGAARASARLTRHVVKRAGGWCRERPGCALRLWCAPDCRHPLFARLCPAEGLRPQPPGELGERLWAISRAALAEARAALLVGGDGVSLTGADYARMAAALARVPVVMVPAEDGGYVALGLTRTAAALFQGIPWGGAEVAEATRQRLRALGWPWEELSPGWDVDTVEGWRRFTALAGEEGTGDG